MEWSQNLTLVINMKYYFTILGFALFAITSTLNASTPFWDPSHPAAVEKAKTKMLLDPAYVAYYEMIQDEITKRHDKLEENICDINYLADEFGVELDNRLIDKPIQEMYKSLSGIRLWFDKLLLVDEARVILKRNKCIWGISYRREMKSRFMRFESHAINEVSKLNRSYDDAKEIFDVQVKKLEETIVNSEGFKFLETVSIIAPSLKLLADRLEGINNSIRK